MKDDQGWDLGGTALFWVRCLSAGCVFVSSAAFAQGSVTLYGVADVGLYYSNVSQPAQGATPARQGTQIGISSGGQSGSRFGLKGVEPLSSGRDVGFVLEGGINLAQGTMAQGGLGFGRQATLWLSDRQLGKLEMGRRANVAFTYMTAIDPLGLAGSQATMGASFGSANSVRYNNLVVYQTPTYRGFQASIGYSFNTGATAVYANGPFQSQQPATSFFGSGENLRALTSGLRYQSGPLLVMATYDQAYGASTVQNPAGTVITGNTNKGSPKAWILGATYDLKVVKLAAAFGQTIGGAFFGQGAGAGQSVAMPLATATRGAGMLFDQGLQTQQYLIGGTIPFGERARLALSWQFMRPVTGSVSADPSATQSIASAMYTYDLSRRTNIYIWGSYGNNFQTIQTARTTALGMGVRHLF